MLSKVSSRSTMAGVYRVLVAAAAVMLFGVFLGAEAQSPTPALATCAMRSNTSCVECLKNVTCLWCGPTQRCIDYPVRNLLPHHSMCPLDAARWGVCWVNFKVLIIIMSVVAAVILIIIAIVCCCCCCRCQRAGSNREAASVELPTRMRNAGKKVRSTEMQLRHDAVRSKYGLATDNPYCQMDDP